MRADPLLIDTVVRHVQALSMEHMIVLRAEGHTFREIGEALGLSAQAVKKRFHKLRNELRDVIR